LEEALPTRSAHGETDCSGSLKGGDLKRSAVVGVGVGWALDEESSFDGIEWRAVCVCESIALWDATKSANSRITLRSKMIAEFNVLIQCAT
jgi:hypothetical protein